jgi:RNA polymerase sigma-70 factor (ECF subfamily)
MPQDPRLTDEELMMNFQKGNQNSFNEIVQRYKNPLVNFVFRFIGNYEDSLDLVQETFIRVYKNKEKYRNIAKFSTWIYTIAANLSKTELRKRHRFLLLPLTIFRSNEDEYEYDIADNSFSPEENTEKILRANIIQKALNKLSASYKEVIILRDLMELSYDEISVITRLRIGTVKSRINRGRLILKKLLKNIHNEK